jgi:hypothetical protein
MGWIVVHSMEGNPIYAEGPYQSKKRASSVAQMLRTDEPIAENGKSIKYTVVKITYLIAPDQLKGLK